MNSEDVEAVIAKAESFVNDAIVVLFSIYSMSTRGSRVLLESREPLVGMNTIASFNYSIMT